MMHMEQYRLLERLGGGNEIQLPKQPTEQEEDNGISVEEGLDTRRNYLRYFSLQNQRTRFNIIISKSSSILGCVIDGQEIVVDGRFYHEEHDTSAIGERPVQKINSLQWNCHVRGKELILSASNGSSNISYGLSPFSVLTSKVKLKSIHLQHQVIYFNLNTATERSSIDGHQLHVYSNRTNRIQCQQTKLLCQCNLRASPLRPESLISDHPCELTQNKLANVANQHQVGGSVNVKLENPIREDDILVCDAIYSLEATEPSDYLAVRLGFAGRVVNVSVQSANQSATTTSMTGNQSEANNTGTSNNTNTRHSIVNATSSSGDSELDPQAVNLPNQIINSEASTSQQQQPQQQQQQPLRFNAKPASTTILRLRVRITNFGACILPHMMTNYHCKHQFSW